MSITIGHTVSGEGMRSRDVGIYTGPYRHARHRRRYIFGSGGVVHMTEIFKRPPNYDAIRKAFPAVPSNAVIFAYGEDIYNPHRVHLSPALRAHEWLHGQRQLKHEGGVEGWWEEYLVDPEFRLHEEVVAHRAEYIAGAVNPKANRRDRRTLFIVTARRLANPMYRYGLSLPTAKRLLKGGLDEAKTERLTKDAVKIARQAFAGKQADDTVTSEGVGSGTRIAT